MVWLLIIFDLWLNRWKNCGVSLHIIRFSWEIPRIQSECESRTINDRIQMKLIDRIKTALKLNGNVSPRRNKNKPIFYVGQFLKRKKHLQNSKKKINLNLKTKKNRRLYRYSTKSIYNQSYFSKFKLIRKKK